MAERLAMHHDFQEVLEKIPEGPQGGAYEWQTILALVIIRPIAGFSSMNALLREIDGDKALQVAFGLEEVPSPSTISRYKNQHFGEETVELLSEEMLCELHLQNILDLTDLVGDGAPIEAHLNTKRFRKLEELPYELIERVFAAEDFSWIEDFLHRRKNCMYTVGNYFMIFQAADTLGFYGVEAFHKVLKKDDQLQEVLGLTNGVPTLQSMRNFKIRVNESLWSRDTNGFPEKDFYTILDELAVRLPLDNVLPPELLPIAVKDRYDLFNLFQTRPHVIEPTARFGYTVSKSKVFTGYRWLTIGTFMPGIPLCHYLGQPSQGEPYLLLKCLKKLQKVLNRLDQLKSRRSGRIYLDGGLKDSKLASYYRLLRIKPCHIEHEDLKSLTPRWTKKRVESEHLIQRLVDYGGMRHHRVRHLRLLNIQAAIAVAALQLTALCALEQKAPALVCSPKRLFS